MICEKYPMHLTRKLIVKKIITGIFTTTILFQMKNNALFLLLLLSSVSIFGQHTVSGFVNFEDPKEWEQQVYLEHLDPASGYTEKKPLAVAAIQENGFFAFDDNVFTKPDQLYRVQVKKIHSGEVPSEQIRGSSADFIISRGDSLYFSGGVGLLSDYITSSAADQEFQKLQKHQATSETGIAMGTDQYLQETRKYSKDSLQILLVKLLSIRTLEEQQLLQKDIRENADYYLHLLAKLQESELPPASYAYLEKRIRMTHQELLQKRYYTSLAFNALALVAIATLLFLLFRTTRKRNSNPNIPLSRQEENVKTLILEGKTNKEIAGELFISLSTVKTHITSIYSKLDVNNRQELRLRS